MVTDQSAPQQCWNTFSWEPLTEDNVTKLALKQNGIFTEKVETLLSRACVPEVPCFWWEYTEVGIVPGVGEIKHGWEEKQLWADRMRLFNWLDIENVPAQRSPCT